jgi:hypothetical protein
MSLENLSSQLSNHGSGSKINLPPVEDWHPDFCGDIDLQIKADGSWFYNGTPFKRLSLVKLFASVLKKENNNYYLVTPVEKVGIKVDDVPFILTNWHWQDETQTSIVVSTNLEDEFILSKEHPLILTKKGGLYVTVRRNLLAKVHRNVYYQWVDIAEEVITEKGTELMLCSAGEQFSLGILEPST